MTFWPKRHPAFQRRTGRIRGTTVIGERPVRSSGGSAPSRSTLVDLLIAGKKQVTEVLAGLHTGSPQGERAGRITQTGDRGAILQFQFPNSLIWRDGQGLPAAAKPDFTPAFAWPGRLRPIHTLEGSRAARHRGPPLHQGAWPRMRVKQLRTLACVSATNASSVIQSGTSAARISKATRPGSAVLGSNSPGRHNRKSCVRS